MFVEVRVRRVRVRRNMRSSEYGFGARLIEQVRRERARRDVFIRTTFVENLDVHTHDEQIPIKKFLTNMVPTNTS